MSDASDVKPTTPTAGPETAASNWTTRQGELRPGKILPGTLCGTPAVLSRRPVAKGRQSFRTEGGLQVSAEHEEEPEESESDRIVVKTVEDRHGNVSSRIRRTWRRFEWGEELVEKVVDPDGAALKTAIEYFDVQAEPGYGKIRKIVNPDGSWKRFEHDVYGRRTKKVACLLTKRTPTPTNPKFAPSITTIPCGTIRIWTWPNTGICPEKSSKPSREPTFPEHGKSNFTSTGIRPKSSKGRPTSPASVSAIRKTSGPSNFSIASTGASRAPAGRSGSRIRRDTGRIRVRMGTFEYYEPEDPHP